MTPGDPRLELGRRAERAVADYLATHGFDIVDRNARLGRLEIDLVARKPALLVFCEVRARSNDRFVAPAQTIDARKVARIRRAAALWLAKHRPGSVDVRFDAAAVVFDRDPPRIEYYAGAF